MFVKDVDLAIYAALASIQWNAIWVFYSIVSYLTFFTLKYRYAA